MSGPLPARSSPSLLRSRAASATTGWRATSFSFRAPQFGALKFMEQEPWLSLQSSVQAFGEVGLGKAIGSRADGPSRSALMRSWVLKAKLITLTQPENFAFSSRRAAKPRNFRTAKLRCGWRDIVGDRLSAGMISDYYDFTMSSTFSATGQLLDVKRAGDRKLARLRSRFTGHGCA